MCTGRGHSAVTQLLPSVTLQLSRSFTDTVLGVKYWSSRITGYHKGWMYYAKKRASGNSRMWWLVLSSESIYSAESHRTLSVSGQGQPRAFWTWFITWNWGRRYSDLCTSNSLTQMCSKINDIIYANRTNKKKTITVLLSDRHLLSVTLFMMTNYWYFWEMDGPIGECSQSQVIQ